MPFPFAYLCDLLDQVTDSLKGGPKVSQQLIKEWFQHHRALVNHEKTDRCALLSCLLPELRTDRKFGIKEAKLKHIVARAWGLGTRERHLTPNKKGKEDFAEAVGRTLNNSPNHPGKCNLTLEVIDKVLEGVASTYRFSCPAVRSLSTGAQAARNEEALREIYRQVTPREAKWLTRMILKDYSPIVLDEHVVYQSCHSLLPCVMKIHDNFAVAMGLLQSHERNSGVIEEPLSRELITTQIKPILGVKVGRQTFLKGRSARDCVDMGYGLMSCEKKMDGEYCQIHVNVENGMAHIQIFSKSKRDSTADRIGVHSAIKNSLNIGSPTCQLKKGCILEGELVVYSDKEKEILGFDEIRKHVTRSGSTIGTEYDSKPHDYEHLMIVYYDALMIDDDSLLNVPRSERFRRLEQLIEYIPGRAELVKRRLIDFSSPTAAAEVQAEIQKCLNEHEEGFVLKADDLYFDFGTSRRRYACCTIKCKPQYNPKLGEVGDFAIVGARFDPVKAKEYCNEIPSLKWTHFYLGCLINQRDVRYKEEKPSYKAVAVVTLNLTQLRYFSRHCWTEETSAESNEKMSVHVERGVDDGKKPSLIFANPAVFEISSFSFHRAGGTSFWGPRFPQVTKIHHDRTHVDCLTFAELQDMAEAETSHGRGIATLEELPSRVPTKSSPKMAMPMTPPRSSPPDCQENESDEVVEITAKEFQSRKRSRPMDPDVQNKRQKRVCPHTPSSSSPMKPASQGRQPLGDITSSSQGNNMLLAARPASQGIQERLISPSGNIKQTPMEEEDLVSSLPAQQSFSCRYSGSNCAVANCLIMLSPYVANLSCVAEDFPKTHEVRGMFTDLGLWINASARKSKKIILVERNRETVMKHFLDRVKALNLQHRGRKLWVEVYDWRLLESINKEERQLHRREDGKTRQTLPTGAHDREIWRKHLVGLI